jgi:protein TonB
MDRRLFEDLVVSTPAAPLGRRAALLPLSVALHAGILALALIVPVLRPGEMPTPAYQRPVWELARVVPPPPVPRETPARVERIPPARVRSGPLVRDLTPVSAPGPPVMAVEPDSFPTDDARVPCFVNCDGPTSPEGAGDGPTGPRDGPNETDGAGTRPVRPGGDIKAPIRMVYVAPVYPDIARAAGVSAIVVVECTIDPTGHVADARVVTGHPLLDEAALSAVRQWRYTATRLNGVPIPVLMTVTVRFTASR